MIWWPRKRIKQIVHKKTCEGEGGTWPYQSWGKLLDRDLQSE